MNRQANNYARLVTAAIIRKHDRVLIARRSQQRKLAGFWEFPGGKVEPGETLQECLERELFEELGIRSRAGAILCSSEYEYDSGVINLIALETEVESHNFTLRDHDRADWVIPETLLSFNLLPADIPIATFLSGIPPTAV